MPIRFRCAYCNQLMAISHRKAGTVVRCPKCTGDIIVPAPDGNPATEEPQQPDQRIFDDPNFDAALHEPDVPLPTVKTPQGPITHQQQPVPAEAELLPEPKRRGIFLPLGLLLIVIGMVGIILVIVFVLGIFVGRSLLTHQSGDKSVHLCLPIQDHPF